MKQLLLRIKTGLLVAMFVGTTIGVPVVVSSGVALAAPSASKQAVCDGAGLTAAECAGRGSGLNGLISTILKILSTIVGVVAIVMVIISGLRYVTSGGEASKVASAKNALIYALVGVVIVALAQILVHFVFAASTA